MKRAIAAIVIICLIGIFIQTALATQISVEPSHIEVAPGEEFTLNITVDPEGNETFAAQYTLYFDNTLLRAQSQNNGPFLGTAGPWVNNIYNDLGKTEYGETRTGDAGVTEPGVLATIDFEVRGNSGTCELRLDEVILLNLSLKPIPTQANNGTLKIKDSQPSSPFLIFGHVFYENGSECLNPEINITNLNRDTEWQAKTNESYNYYRHMLISCTDIIAGKVLQFNVTSADGSQLNITEHTVTLDDINKGGIFNFNISLASAATYNLSLSSEWNLISIPLIPENTSLNEILEDKLTGGTSLSDADAVWGWTGTTWETAILIEGTGDPAYDGKWFTTGYQPTTMTIEPDKGYWIHILPGHPNVNITTTGTESAENRTIAVNKGWNLVGSAFIEPVPLNYSGLFESGCTGGTSLSDADAVWRWTGTTWGTAILINGTGDPAYDGKWFDTGYQPTQMTFSPGRGYWIHVLDTHDGFTWEYPKQE